MSASERMQRSVTRVPWTARARLNVIGFFALFCRRRRSPFMRPISLPLAICVLAAIAAIGIVMITLDARAIAMVPHLPLWLIASFRWVTDFGKSYWFLDPLAVVLAMLAVLASPALPAISRAVLAAVAVRLAFLFSAIALPGLVFTIVKRLIGRARPLVGGSIDPFLYSPLSWKVQYASFPSGHAVDAFAAAAAIGALWPKARPLMWTYAVIIALSRVAVTAHFPSDVIAGAIFAVAGVLLVRAWFASRRLAFAPGAGGRIRPMAGPSLARLKRVARQMLHP
jgi:membrane-associated phospholipid phosphatase